eukprot:scaffold507456_cov31-Prasinocladus_malaysianus.AAC.1
MRDELGPPLDSSLMVYPTESPGDSPRSAATRSATETALILRGWVQKQRQPRPSAHSASSKN